MDEDRGDALYERFRFGNQFPVADEAALRAVMREAADALPMEQVMQLIPHVFNMVSSERCEDVVGGYLDRYVETRLAPFIEMVNAPHEGRGRVVFIASEINYKIHREAKYLRRNGLRTYLISLAPYDDSVRQAFESGFDACLPLQMNLNLLQRLLDRLAPEVYHVHASMFAYALARTVIEHKGDAKVICELNDITTVYAEPEVLAMVASEEDVELDYAMERYLCHHADGLIYQFSDAVQDELRGRHGALPPAIQMQPYPCPEYIRYDSDKFSRQDGIVRCVFPGNTPTMGPNHPPEIFPSRGLYDAAVSFCSQGVGVDIVVDPSKSHDISDPGYAAWHELQQRFGHFRIRPGVSPDRITEAIGRYDFGLIAMRIDWNVLRVRPSKLKLQTANKFFAFLEAGLPIIVCAEMEYMASLAEELGVGFAIPSDEFDQIAERIAAFDYDAAVENIRRYNERHNMGREIHRLIDFYAELGAIEHAELSRRAV